jgi:hypothetical protein
VALVAPATLYERGAGNRQQMVAGSLNVSKASHCHVATRRLPERRATRSQVPVSA